MKSRPVQSGQIGRAASQFDTTRDDARGGSFLLAHQQLGALALGTVPTNGQVVPIVINGTTITVTAVTVIGSTANNVLIGGSAAAFVQNLVNFLRRPDFTNSNQVAASSANQALLSYVGWAWPGASTNIVPFSLNKNVNGLSGQLTSFNITGITVTSGTWTAQTMQLYVEDGTYFIAGTRYLFTGGSTGTVTAPSTHPRIDVLSLDNTGTLNWTTGTESVSPVAPTYPKNQIVICELYNVVSETALYDNENQQAGQGYIYNDVRPVMLNPYGQFILDPGSEAQGDVLYYNGSAWVRLPAGTSGFYLQTQGPSANPQWAAIGLQTVTGSDTPSNTTAPTTITDTITHGLGRTPSIIIISASWSASVPSGGSGATNKQTTGYLTVDKNGNAIGGFEIVVNQTSSTVTSATSPTASLASSNSDSFGTENETITVANIGSTTFQIVYTSSGSYGGHNPTTAFPAVTWTCIG